MKLYFIQLFNYHNWANKKVIDGIKAAGITDDSIMKILSHILLGEKVWLQRLKSEKYDNKFWLPLSLDECSKLSIENSSMISGYLNALQEEDLEKKVTYVNSKGNKYTNSVEQILTHLSHHSSYHRGQIAREMRRLGKEPVYTDYVAYLR